MNDLPAELKKSGNLILLEMPRWDGTTRPVKNAKSWVERRKPDGTHGDQLVIAGDDESSLNIAAIDFVLRYWKYAKDSGMRRVPLTDQPIPEKGPDPGALP